MSRTLWSVALLLLLALAQCLAASLSNEEILCQFYNQTNGPEWRFNRHWCDEDYPVACPSGDWFGVSCDGSAVTSLLLSNNNIQGSLPSSFSQLSNLTHLDMSNNRIDGQISVSVCPISELNYIDLSNNNILDAVSACYFKMPVLEYLDLSSNDIIGELLFDTRVTSPLQTLKISNNNMRGWLPDFSPLPELQHLELSSNYFQGEIHSQFDLHSLTHLDLSHNILTSPLPPSLAGHPLETLNLKDNFFFGSFPEQWAELNELKYMYLGFNRINGTLPGWMFRLPKLIHLFLQDNGLEGELPACIGNATSMTLLSVAQNHFTGPIPDEIASLNNLEHFLGFVNEFTYVPDVFHSEMALKDFAVYHNKIRGTVPTSFALLPNITSLWIHMNGFYGPMPKLTQESLVSIHIQDNFINGTLDEIFDYSKPMPNLSEFLAKQNQLTGTLPNGLFTFSKMRLLGLAINNLEGEIPNDICQLTKLHKLGLENNNFHGTIPHCLFLSLTDIKELHLGANNLEGPLPQVYAQSCETLTILSAENNNLNGTIPSNLPYCRNVTELLLDNNQITGTLPENINEMVHLRVLRLNSNYLTGTMPMTVAALPYLSELSLRNNQFTGTIPIELGSDVVPEIDRSCQETSLLYYTKAQLCFVFKLRELTVLDISENDFEGELPVQIYYIDTLYFLNIEGNPRMKSETPIQFQLRNTSATSYDGHFECHPIDTASATFTYDQSYFDYEYCVCSNGYYGVPPDNCQHCPHGAECPGGDYVNILIGTYPICEGEEDCNTEGSELIGVEHCHGEEHQCVPEGTCAYIPSLGLDPDCILCEEGYEGRLCSECTEGYYHRGENCYECADIHMVWFLPAFILGWIITSVAAAADYHITHLVGEVAVITLLWMVNAVPVWLVYFIFLLLIAQILNFICAHLLAFFSKRREDARPEHLKKHKNHHRYHAHLSHGSIEAILFYLQAKEAIFLSLNIHGEEFDPIGINQYQLGGPECYSPIFDVYGKFVMVMVLPLGVFVSVAIVFATGCAMIYFGRMYKKYKRRQAKATEQTSEMEGLVGSYYNESNDGDEDDEEYDSSYDSEEEEFREISEAYMYRDTTETSPEFLLADIDSSLTMSDITIADAPVPKSRRAYSKWTNRCLRSGLLMTTILYFEISKNIFEMLGCAPDPLEEGVYWMEHAPYVKCYQYSLADYHDGGVWAYIFYTAVFCFIIYTIGIPVLWLTLLIHAWWKQKLHKPSVISRIGYLYEDYRPHLWMWQIFTSGRLLIIIALSAVLLNSNPWQPVLIFCVVVLSLAIHATARPYFNVWDNLITSWAMVAIGCGFIMLLFMVRTIEGYDEFTGGSTISSILDSFTFFFLLLSLLKPTFKMGGKLFCAVGKEVTSMPYLAKSVLERGTKGDHGDAHSHH